MKRKANARHSVSKTALHSEDFWDFMPGQRVMTIDRIAGVVTEVQDECPLGSEAYTVRLDNGMGGGDYTASQLEPLSQKPTAAKIQADVDTKTAADDYPELTEILSERPPLEINVAGSKKVAWDKDEWDERYDDHGDVKICTACEGEGEVNGAECNQCGGAGRMDEIEKTGQTAPEGSKTKKEGDEYVLRHPNGREIARSKDKKLLDDYAKGKVSAKVAAQGPDGNFIYTLPDKYEDDDCLKCGGWGKINRGEPSEAMCPECYGDGEEGYTGSLKTAGAGSCGGCGSSDTVVAQGETAYFVCNSCGKVGTNVEQDIASDAGTINQGLGDPQPSLSQSADGMGVATAGFFGDVFDNIGTAPGHNKSYDWCFLPDAPVLMADGTEKPISQIQVGDRVITHTGLVQPVTWVGSRLYEGDLVYLSMHGDTTREVVATDQHRFWVANRDFGLSGNPKAAYYLKRCPSTLAPRHGWDEIGNLQVGDYLSRSVLTEETPLLVQYRKPGSIETFETRVEGEIAWLLGLYMGDGFPQAKGCTSFSLHEDQQHLVERLRQVARGAFGVNTSVYPEKGKRAVRVDIRHWALSQMVEELVGHGSSTKILDERLLVMPLTEQRTLLDGYIDSDGCISSDGRFCVDSVSIMPRQIREIATRLGHLVNMRPKWSTDRYANAKDQIRVEWWAGKNRLTKQFRRDGTVWQQVKSTRREHYVGEVWDIEVAEDHSFRAYGFNVHNCRFRRDSRCYHPKDLDPVGTAEAGYAVWQIVDRGWCPRTAWEEQEDCPVGQPGPNVPGIGQVEVTRPWNQGGQRQSSLNSGDMGFHLTATWKDVREKAQRIRSEGGVRIISVPDGQAMVAQVKGDENVYQTMITRVIGKQSVAMWECGCSWSAYSWGRSGRWKKYEGRMCAHALALAYEAQSRGWGKREVQEDKKKPSWMDETSTVKVPGDYNLDKGRYSSLRPVWADYDPSSQGNDLAPGVMLAAAALEIGEEPVTVVANLRAMGAVNAQGMLHEALKVKEFAAKVRGRIVKVVKAVERDLFSLDNGDTVPAQVIQHPLWHPTMGLEFRTQGSQVVAVQHDEVAVVEKPLVQPVELPMPMLRTAMRTFSPAEQKSIIDEGIDIRASNLDRLDIRGTHYEALAALDDEGDFL